MSDQFFFSKYFRIVGFELIYLILLISSKIILKSENWWILRMFENILSKNPITFFTKIFKIQWILRNSFHTISIPQQYRPFTVHGILVCYSLFSLWQSPIFRIHSLLLSNSNDIRWSAFNAAIRTVPSIMFYIVRWETQTLIRFILIGVFSVVFFKPSTNYYLPFQLK